MTSLYLVGSSLGAMALPSTMGALLERFGAVALPIECSIGIVISVALILAFAKLRRH